MSVFNVHIIIANCFIPSTLRLSESIMIEPFEGIGIKDIADLIDKYSEQVLNQPP